MRLVFDFDGTITKKDTIEELVQSSIKLQKARTGHNLQQSWESAVQTYLNEYESHKSNYVPAPADRTSIIQEKAYLASLKAVEEASLSRVSKSGIFSRLTSEDLFQMGVDSVSSGRVAIRAGFHALVASAKRHGVPTAVVSVNWSAHFIRGVLHDTETAIVANDISENGEICGPSTLSERVTTSADKLRALKTLAGFEEEEDVVYFGDSVGDTECLVWKRGVVITDDERRSSLLEMMRRVGGNVAQAGEPLGSDMVWASDFREVPESWIFGV